MKKAKRAISLLTVMCMLVCMVPVMSNSGAVHATATNIYVGNVPLDDSVYYYKNSGAGSIIPGDENDYNLKYIPSEQRLMMNGLIVTAGCIMVGESADVTIEVENESENLISCETFGIADQAVSGTLTITGSGVLTIELTGKNFSLGGNNSAAIISGRNIAIGGSVGLICIGATDEAPMTNSQDSGSYGIYTQGGSVTIGDSANVEARGRNSLSDDSPIVSYGIFSARGIAVTGNAILNAYSGDAVTNGDSKTAISEAVCAANGNIEIGPQATVRAECGDATATGAVDLSKSPLSAGVYARNDVNVEGHLTATSGIARGLDENSHNYGKTYGIFAGGGLISDASSSSQGRNAVISATSIKVNSDVKLNNSEVNVNANFSNDLQNAFDVENRTLTATNSAITIMLTGVADGANPYGLIATDIYLDNTSLDVEFDNLTAPRDIAGIKVSSILQLSGQETDVSIVYRSTCSLFDPTGIYASSGTVSALDNAHLAINFEGQPRYVTGMWVGRLDLQNANLDITATGSGSLITEGNVQGIYCSKVNIENSNAVIDFGSSLAGADSRCIRAIRGNANEDNVSIINSDVRLMPGAATGESIGIEAIGNVIISSGAIIGNAENLTTKAIDVASADKLTIAEGLHWATAAGVATTNGAYTWSADDSLLIITTSAIVPYSGGSSHHSGGGGGSSASGAGTTETVAPDGSKTTVTVSDDGSKTTVKTDANDNLVYAEAAISEKAVAGAVAKGEAVKLGVSVKAATSAEEAVPVKVVLPASVTPKNPATVEIPVENMTAGTVAVVVYGDGTEEIVKTSVAGEDGIVMLLEGSETIKIIDNTKRFSDVAGSEWFAGNVAWAASREIMNGIGGGIFDAGSLTNRGMISQILFNLEGARATAAQMAKAAELFSDVSTGNWFAGSIGWLIANDIAQGQGSDFGAADPVTREQLAVLYFNYAKYKGYDTGMRGSVEGFADSGRVSPWAQEALAWAVGKGIINGTALADGSIALDPQGSSTRAMVAAITQRFCEKLL